MYNMNNKLDTKRIYYKVLTITAEDLFLHFLSNSVLVLILSLLVLPVHLSSRLNKCFVFFLLTQGEYIAPEKIENVYLRSPFAAQVFVCGNSLKVCTILTPKTGNFIDGVI